MVLTTVVATAVRDRADLVAPFLESAKVALPADVPVVAWLDPLSRDVGVDWLVERGIHAVVTLPVASTDSPKVRVRRMRADAARYARDVGASRVLYLDSDVVLSRGFWPEFERLWGHLHEARCGALSLGNLGLYDRHVVERLPRLRATVRKFALGSCLAFPVTDLLLDVAGEDPGPGSWDTHFSRAVAGCRVLTSDESFLRHDGRYSGMCAATAYGLDYQNLAFDLR